MKLKRKALLHDIANMAYLISDTNDYGNHALHRVRDICEEGNIDRVSRVLGLAYSGILSVLFPILQTPGFDVNRDNSAEPHDYPIIFSRKGSLRFALTKEKQLHIKETCHEYMVCMVLADWLAVTLPEAADVWKFRAEKAFEALRSQLAEILLDDNIIYGRKISPL